MQVLGGQTRTSRSLSDNCGCASKQNFKAREQVRDFALDGDELTIRTPEQPSATAPGKRVISKLHWRRAK